MSDDELRTLRLRAWRQDAARTVAGPDEARGFIEEMGVCTLYAASSEFPSLYQAHMGQENPPSFGTWDSPQGYVYGWRWALGKSGAAFYSSVVAKKPTWIAWRVLPTVLGALMERRTPDELFDLGLLSPAAYRIAGVLEQADEPVLTGDLRAAAGFPTGKANRAEYLKGVEELESLLLLAKVFHAGDEDDAMRHVLVSRSQPKDVAAALAMNRQEALTDLVRGHLRHAAFLRAKPFARHLRVDPALLGEAVDILRQSGEVRETTIGGERAFALSPDHKGDL